MVTPRNQKMTKKRITFEPVTTERKEALNSAMPQSELQGIETCREKSEAISPLN